MTHLPSEKGCEMEEKGKAAHTSLWVQGSPLMSQRDGGKKGMESS